MNNLKYILVAAIVSTSMTGCGLYSNYTRTVDEQMVDGLYDYTKASDESENLATLSWRELFADPYLQALIEEALESNTDLNVARLSVEQAEISLATARKAFLPSLSFSPQGTISSFQGSTTKSYTTPLTASWEVDIFGKLRNAKEQSKAALEQSTAYRQAVQTQLIATLAGSYYSLLMLDEQLSISEQTQQNWAENLRVMEAMLKAGRINETAVLQSRASNISLSSQIVTIKEQIAALENSISALLAKPTVEIQRGTIFECEFPEELSVGLPIELLCNRPDVRMAESNLAEAFYATSEARSSLYPSITLSGSAGFTNASGSITNPSDMLYSAVGSLVQPIFQRGALRAQLKISEAQQEQALLQFNQSIIDAGTEVNNALSEWQGAQERLEYADQQVELLAATLSKTELLMKYGSATYIEVLTAQLTLLQADLSSVNEIYNKAQGVINLYRALGGGEE
ncbi:MAG: TolC family protein [Rikenellaceae bacterium]